MKGEIDHNLSVSDPPVPLADPPFQCEQSCEREEERPVVPDLQVGLTERLGRDPTLERLKVLRQLLRRERLAAGELGDLAESEPVGGGVLQLAVVLVDEEPGAVAADLLAVA